MFDMVHMGFWVVVPYSAIRLLPRLKIAPAGVVPQRDRRPRPIIDYTYNGVNTASLDLAPKHAMQFGLALPRLLQRLAYCNPKFGPPLMAKVDLADGYYRIPLSATAALELAVVLPSDGASGPLIGIPLSLPMGWRDSPPYFCAFTETCADLANMEAALGDHPYDYALIQQPEHAIIHPAASHTIYPYNPQPPAAPLAFTDVYLDDFMIVAQPPKHYPSMNNLLYHLSTIFWDQQHSPRRLIVSQSKVEKGDATFSTIKRFLGWDIHSHDLTLHLPSHRVTRLTELLQHYIGKKYATRRQWQSLLGELHSMTLALHSSKLLFSILQQRLLNHNRRLRITALQRQALRDWLHLVNTLSQYPVPIAALVPHAPHYVAMSDASGAGLGGCWFPTTLVADTQPCAWRLALPPQLQAQLATRDNRAGAVNNSELELAAAIGTHLTALHATPPLPYRTMLIGTDNAATQAWLTRGSTSSIGPTAFLLRTPAHENRNFNANLDATFIAGTSNSIADFLSRSVALSDHSVLHTLQTLWPIQPPWKLVTPPAHLASTLNSALLSRLPVEASRQAALAAMTPRGTHGPNSAAPCIRTHGSAPLTTPSPCCKSSLIATDWVSWLPPALQSRLERWKEPFEPWGRRSPHWDTTTHDSSRRVASTSVYTVNCNVTTRSTPHLHE
jgi:hypothetical protein